MASSLDALRQDVREHTCMARGTLRLKAAAKSCMTLAFSAVEAVGIGSSSPLKAVAIRGYGLFARIFFQQTNVDAYTTFGRKQTSTFSSTTTCGGIGEHDVHDSLIRSLSYRAREMGLSGFALARGSDTSPILIHSEAASFYPEKVLTCHPCLFYTPERGERAAKQTFDPEERRFVRQLSSHWASAEFLGVQSLASIKMNVHLLIVATQLAALFFGKMAADRLAGNLDLDSSGWTFTLFTGFFSKGVATCATSLVHRFFCFRADRAAVEITKHKYGAVQCLHILKNAPKQLTALEKALVYLTHPNLLLLPSPEARIRHLDPQGEISAPEYSEPVLSEEQEALRLLATRNMLAPALALRTNVRIIQQLSKQQLKNAVKFLASSYVSTRYVGPKITLAMAVFMLYYRLTPRLQEEALYSLPPQLRPTSCSQELPFSPEQTIVTQAAHELGIRKPVQVREQQVGHCSAHGIGFGPGQAVIKTTKNTPHNSFVLRHELAHIRRSDNFLGIDLPALGTFLTLNLLLDSPEGVLATLAQGAFVMTAVKVVLIFSSRRFEARADIDAVMTAPADQRSALIADGLRFFREERARNRAVRQNQDLPFVLCLLARVETTSAGDTRFDFMHPSLTQRSEALLALQKRIS